MKAAEERNRERLSHISVAIEKIGHYTAGLSEEVFCNDFRTNEAVLFQFSVIGEAVVHVDKALLDKYKYPWHEVRALRNLIAHEYFGIKLDKIWSIVRDDLPGLKSMIDNMLSEEF